MRFLLGGLCAALAFFGVALGIVLSNLPEEAEAATRVPVPRASPEVALGSVEGLDPALRRALDPGADFTVLADPEPGDWLYDRPDEGQTFAQFLEWEPNLLTEARDKIYVQPIGALTKEPSLAELEDYAERYFHGLDVVVLPATEPDAVGARQRRSGKHRQLHAGDITDYLKERLRDDAYCMIALTEIDLWSGGGWNFVFGQASLGQRVGVFSFARNDDAFYDDPASPPQLVKKRALQVMTHEIGHMFGMSHCVQYSCNMNGSNSLAESDTQPPHLCPVCQRKLHHIIGFESADRYSELSEYYEAAGFTEEAAFTRRRRDFILQR